LISANDLRRAVEKAGMPIRRLYGRAKAWSKAGGSPLTEADLRSNAVLKRELLRLQPRAGWLSEEGRDGKARLSREWVWIVDPLDGTKEFVRGVPEVAVSVGLVRRGRVVAGAVYNPLSGEGGAVAPNGRPIFWGLIPRRGRAPGLRQAVVSVSRTEVEDGSVGPYLGLFRKARPVGGAAYKLLRAAAGIEDLCLSVQPKNEWDICGGVALLEAAGLAYRRLDGRPLKFNRAGTRVRSGAAAGPESLINALMRRIELAT
jgi:myo-inositol-1(or 4)-monophosphatase